MIELKKIVIVVVIFEKDLRNSQTLESLSGQINNYANDIGVDLVVCDNSLVSRFSDEYFRSYPSYFNVIYNSTPDNKSLREIYNSVVDGLGFNEIVVWLDDDTSLDARYLDELILASDKHKNINLFLPRVYVNKSLYSPYFSFLFFGRAITRPPAGLISSKYIGAINSGMAIRSDFFFLNRFKYPSFVEFYGTDKVFCDFFMNTDKELCVLDVDIDHDVTCHPANSSNEQYLASLMKVDLFWRKYYKGNKLVYYMYCVYIFCYCLKVAFKRKSALFIKLPFVSNMYE